MVQDYVRTPPTLSFTYDTSAKSIGEGWEIKIYDSSKKEMHTISDIESDTTYTFKTKKNKKYYIEVCADSYDGWNQPTNVKYTLTVK